MPQEIPLTAGDTDPIAIQITARRAGALITDLSAFGSAKAYFHNADGGANEINGANVTLLDSSNRLVQLDPKGAAAAGADAFATEGIYDGKIAVTWSDGRVTYHPPGDEFLRVVVGPTGQ